MQYIIMCGGKYKKWERPRQLIEIKGEPIVARTIRLLRENGVEDIAISSNNPEFWRFGVPVLEHENSYDAIEYNNFAGYWCDAFYPTDDPACYLFGDVIYSPAAIRTIVTTETDDIAFFGSKQPFAKEYPKPWIEPFAFKVQNQEHLHYAVERVKELDRNGWFHRKPIAWEVWNVINGGDINHIDPDSYIGINDYTCDIDYPYEVLQIAQAIDRSEGSG